MRILINGIQLFLHCLICYSAYHHIEWSYNQRQRGTQFMTDVGKETEFHLIQFFFLFQSLLLLHTNHSLVITTVDYIDYSYYGQTAKNCIKDTGENCIPERRMNRYGKLRLRSPYPVISGCRYTKNIFTGRKIIIGNTPLPAFKQCFSPFFIKSVQQIAERGLRRIGKVQPGKFKRYEILIIVQRNSV